MNIMRNKVMNCGIVVYAFSETSVHIVSCASFPRVDFEAQLTFINVP